MKKIIVATGLVVTMIVASCGSNARKDTNNPAQDSTHSGDNSDLKANPDRPDNNVDNPRAMTSDPAYQEGAVLVANNACKTCHTIDKKMVGPSFNMIADRYSNSAGMRDELAHKIVYGGVGRWGNVAMPAQNNLTLTQANEIANYILSLKTK